MLVPKYGMEALEAVGARIVKGVGTMSTPSKDDDRILFQDIDLYFEDGTWLMIRMRKGGMAVALHPSKDAEDTEDFLFKYQKLCERYGRHIEGRDNQGGPIWSKDNDDG